MKILFSFSKRFHRTTVPAAMTFGQPEVRLIGAHLECSPFCQYPGLASSIASAFSIFWRNHFLNRTKRYHSLNIDLRLSLFTVENLVDARLWGGKGRRVEGGAKRKGGGEISKKKKGEIVFYLSWGNVVGMILNYL